MVLAGTVDIPGSVAGKMKDLIHIKKSQFVFLADFSEVGKSRNQITSV